MIENALPVSLIIVLVTILGLMVGSFLNVVIYRLPIMMDREEKKWAYELINGEGKEDPELKDTVFNLAFPASACPKCQHKIKWYENIPVISWIALKGKCSSCGNPISKRYIGVELFTAALSLLVAINYHQNYEQLAFALVLTWSLITLFFIDMDHQILPDRITLPIMWLGIIAALYNNQFVDLTTSVVGAIIGYMSMWLVYWVFKLITGKEGMGYGDFKLLALLCAWQGALYLPYILLIASVLGLLYAVYARIGRAQPIAFGPFLAIAGWITFMYGNHILSATVFTPI